MGEFSPFHWLIVFWLFFGRTLFGLPLLAYRHGKQIGDATGRESKVNSSDEIQDAPRLAKFLCRRRSLAYALRPQFNVLVVGIVHILRRIKP